MCSTSYTYILYEVWLRHVISLDPVVSKQGDVAAAHQGLTKSFDALFLICLNGWRGFLRKKGFVDVVVCPVNVFTEEVLRDRSGNAMLNNGGNKVENAQHSEADENPPGWPSRILFHDLGPA